VDAGGIRYLSVADVLALHAAVLEAMGRAPAPPRDAGALEGAVYRCQQAAHYGGADLWAQAALLAAGIAEAQAFADGNKRTGLVAALTFLDLNGRPYAGDDLAVAEALVAVGAAPEADARADRIAALAAVLRGG
jgi:death-on-curing protein